MGVHRQLQRWVDAGVLDPESAKKIEAYEASRESFSIGAWILGLGIVAIGIGLIALVASNWDGITPGVKLGCDFLILLGLALAVLRTQGSKEKGMQHELCIGVLFFFTLASLALVGQIYRIDAPMARTLLSWFAITTPLLLLSKSSFLASIWALLGAIVYAYQIEPLEAILERLDQIEVLLIAYLWAGPLLFRALGCAGQLQRRCPQQAASLRRISDLASILGAALCTAPWYDTHRAGEAWGLTLIAVTVLLALTLLFRKKLWPQAKALALKCRLGLWIVSWLSLMLGLGLGRAEELPWIAAVFQLAMIGLMIGLSMAQAKIHRFRFWIGAACLRLLVIYFEIFGSLLDTGLALITGGVLIVALAALWRKLTRRWEDRNASDATS